MNLRRRKSGGEWRVSDTAKANSAKSTPLIYVLRSRLKQGTREALFAARAKILFIAASEKPSSE
jgi:hypothetical protein